MTEPKRVRRWGYRALTAYAILAFDAERAVVTGWNPHGNTRTVKGEPGLANGYHTKRGWIGNPS